MPTLRVVAVGVLLAAVALGARPASGQRDAGGRPAPSAIEGSVYGASWAVVIGINDYQSPRVPRLRYAVNDARAVEKALLNQGFHRDQIITLLNEQATKAAIERVLGDELRGQVGPQDRLFVFFAGHGKTDRLRSGEEEGYLLPVDGDPNQLFSTAISMDGLRKISDRLQAKHILYVVDACYSGYAIFSRAVSDALLEEMVRKPAIQILTAGRQGDEAAERGGHGVFTEVFLRGIQGEAFVGKSWVSLEELGVWVKQRVYVESGRLQLPQYGNLHGEGQFVFLRPGPAVAAAAARTEHITVKSDRTTLAASTRGDVARLNASPGSELSFVPVSVGAFGTFTPVPAGAPAGTEVVNIPPGDGKSGFFKATFVLPAGFSTASLSGSANVDDMGRVFLNGTPLTRAMPCSGPNCVSQFGNATFETSDQSLFVAGTNVLVISDLNTGGPSGVAFFAHVRFIRAP